MIVVPICVCILAGEEIAANLWRIDLHYEVDRVVGG
jgi:hypothetical protein